MADKQGGVLGMGRLAGRLAVVTGGSTGIGRAVCQLFAAEGASIVLADVNEVEGQATVTSLPALGPHPHRFYKIDVSCVECINKMVSVLRQEYPSAPSIVVTCAGVAMRAPFLQIEEADYDATMNINGKGTFFMVQALAKLMIEKNAKDGAFVTVGSIAAKGGPTGLAHYSASKGAVVAMSKVIAVELAQYGIRCNAICPGVIDTNMVNKKDMAGVKEDFLKVLPLGRAGDPAEVAKLCLFLATAESSYMTGQDVYITGGL